MPTSRKYSKNKPFTQFFEIKKPPALPNIGRQASYWIEVLLRAPQPFPENFCDNYSHQTQRENNFARVCFGPLFHALRRMVGFSSFDVLECVRHKRYELNPSLETSDVDALSCFTQELFPVFNYLTYTKNVNRTAYLRLY